MQHVLGRKRSVCRRADFVSTRRERWAALAGAVTLATSVAMVTLDVDAERLGASIVAMATGAGVPAREDGQKSGSQKSGSQESHVPGGNGSERLVGGYLGVTHTHPSKVTIENPGRTSMSTGDLAWEGKPFKSPIYYGLRFIRWAEGGRVGALVDFTHAKAVSRFEEQTTFAGTYEGKPLAPTGKVGDVFKHLEFSHGHNMLTLNGLLRLGAFPVQPYVGAGAGISLPHTEVGFRAEKGRTYEYQYAGLTGQVLAGLEVRVGKTSLFLEYKFSYSAYDVPLSNVDGSYLFVDLWRQFRAWATGEQPPGGRLRTPLLTHHGIGGVMIRIAPASGRPASG